MTRALSGLMAAALTGALLGYQAEWLGASGGWDEMHLAFATMRGTFLFALAYGAFQAWRWLMPCGWIWPPLVSPLLLSPFLGAFLFVLVAFVPNSVEYYRAFPDIWWAKWRWIIAEHGIRVVFFGFVALPIMQVTDAILRWMESATRWDDR